jgi:hypothetical protein
MPQSLQVQPQRDSSSPNGLRKSLQTLPIPVLQNFVQMRETPLSQGCCQDVPRQEMQMCANPHKMPQGFMENVCRFQVFVQIPKAAQAKLKSDGPAMQTCLGQVPYPV